MASFLSLFFFLICGCWWADSAPAPRFGLQVLPSTEMPLAFGGRKCPLSGSRLLQHIEEGTLSRAVCKSAHLLCDADVEISEDEGFLPHIENAARPSDSKTLFVSRREMSAGRGIPSPSLRNRIPFRAFLPQDVSERLPFSYQSLPALMRVLRIPSGTRLAQHMEKTVSMCTQLRALEAAGEVKQGACVRSMEEMVQYATSRLGFPQKQLGILESTSTPIPDEQQPEQQQTMIVTHAALKSRRGAAVVCRDVTFPYAVFVCDGVENVETMEVKMRSGDGEREMVGVMVCGEGEVCEWLGEGSVVWVVKEEELAMAMGGAWGNAKLFGEAGDKVDGAVGEVKDYGKGVFDALKGKGV